MPYAGRFNSIRRDNRRSPVRRFSRSPIRKKSRSPIRRKSRSPMRRKSPVRRKSPMRKKSRSPVPKNRRLSSPIRRKSPSPFRGKGRSPFRRSSRSPVKRKLSGKRRSPSPVKMKHRSRSPTKNKFNKNYSPLRKRDDSEERPNSRSWNNERSGGGKQKRQRSFSRSPVRHLSPPYTSPTRAVLDRRASPTPTKSAGPKIIRDTSGIDRLDPLIIRKKTLNDRFRAVDDGHFEIEENITIGIQRNPYAPASASVTVKKVFDPHLFTMIQNRDAGKRAVFDRPELKYFRFDDLPHDDTIEYEKRTIKVASVKPAASTSKRRSLHISRSPSPKRPTEVRMEMRPDPKYERLFQDSLHDDGPSNFRDKSRQAKVITNPNDLRHNISKRQEEDARLRLDAKRVPDRGRDLDRSRERNRSRTRSRTRSRSRSMSRGRQRDRDNRQVQPRSRSDNQSDKNLPDFSRRPGKNRLEDWQDSPLYIPKGISYYQHDTREGSKRGRRFFQPRGNLKSPTSSTDPHPRDSKPPPFKPKQVQGRGGFSRGGGGGGGGRGGGGFSRGGFGQGGGNIQGGRGRGGGGIVRGGALMRGRNILNEGGENDFKNKWKQGKPDNFKKHFRGGRDGLADRGKWKHDLFEQQAKTEPETGAGNNAPT